MMERYVLKNGKKLRYGYTTGSCAAAAAKASAIMLKSKEKINEVEIDTPKGWNLKIQIHDADFNDKKASCSVVKDSGDDPDVTNGLKIFAEVASTGRKNIKIIGGKGIGKVTKEGLSLEPGEWAINPTPRKMILEEIRKIFPKGGYIIKLWIPKGEEVAKKTFNPKLGIEGGISIIGTSGIVEPMSEEAFKESIRLEMK
jgi:cobalt-precorrin-5B (C1)-methyltransferase